MGVDEEILSLSGRRPRPGRRVDTGRHTREGHAVREVVGESIHRRTKTKRLKRGGRERGSDALEGLQK